MPKLKSNKCSKKIKRTSKKKHGGMYKTRTLNKVHIGAKTADGDIDTKQHTVANMTPTENTKYGISQYYKHPGCTSRLKKLGLTNLSDFYNFMFNEYKTRERKTE